MAVSCSGAVPQESSPQETQTHTPSRRTATIPQHQLQGTLTLRLFNIFCVARWAYLGEFIPLRSGFLYFLPDWFGKALQ